LRGSWFGNYTYNQTAERGKKRDTVPVLHYVNRKIGIGRERDREGEKEV